MRCFTLFVTHFPMVCDLSVDLPGAVAPYHMCARSRKATCSRRGRSYLVTANRGPEADAQTEPTGLGTTAEQVAASAAQLLQPVTFLFTLVPGPQRQLRQWLRWLTDDCRCRRRVLR